MSTAFLGLGSNLGNREANLNKALELLAAGGMRVQAVSPIYESEPEGFAAQPRFLNAVCQVETHLPPQELLALAKRIEAAMGRTDPFRNAPRVIDLDLLLYDDLVLADDNMEVPHPRMATRAFVLVPLADVAPDARHPLLGRTAAELAQRVSREGLRPWDPNAAAVRPLKD